MTELERRYSRLVRWFYPAAYREERGSEIVGTYLEVTDPARSRPALADVADLAAAGIRERVHAAGITDLAPAFRLAGTLALITATGVAAAWTVLEVAPQPPESRAFHCGPFASLGAVVWLAWLLAAMVHVVAPGRWTRLTIGAALLVTVGIVPITPLTTEFRPPLFVLLPQAALGVVALAGAGRRPLPIRLLPVAVAATVFTPNAIAMTRDYFDLSYYGQTGEQVLSSTGTALLTVTLLLTVSLAIRGDYHGGWTLLVLAAPIATLYLQRLAAIVNDDLTGSPNPTYRTMAAIAAVTTLLGPALLLLALRTRRPRRTSTPTPPVCTSCGAHLQSTAEPH
ncbi:hypothetical protein ACTOB_006294 [Actinoplanes oblitus]|uniref:Integral membrane protein n=1 Tax=Actinoplanes oblitus TaxID=3040509 RepID=A0ABY8WAZ9_9ACTN|nr:hypothetical protein [Actinoplanes oblitus]WIM94278.1 hypothetical protein ACTOB_006294 [Actinoplanes oblitus]